MTHQSNDGKFTVMGTLAPNGWYRIEQLPENQVQDSQVQQNDTVCDPHSSEGTEADDDTDSQSEQSG